MPWQVGKREIKIMEWGRDPETPPGCSFENISGRQDYPIFAITDKESSYPPKSFL